jgi:hypothetical protein
MVPPSSVLGLLDGTQSLRPADPEPAAHIHVALTLGLVTSASGADLAAGRPASGW